MQFRKYKKFAAISIVLAFLLPALVTATVVISYLYPTSTSSSSPDIYLEEGPNYETAKALNLFYLAPQPSSTTTPIPVTTTIDINATSGASDTYLLNVLEIHNNTPSGITWGGNSLTVYISYSAGSGSTTSLTLYYSSSQLTWTGTGIGTGISGTSETLSSSPISITLPTSTTNEYLGFSASGSGTGTLTISYYIP